MANKTKQFTVCDACNAEEENTTLGGSANAKPENWSLWKVGHHFGADKDLCPKCSEHFTKLFLAIVQQKPYEYA